MVYDAPALLRHLCSRICTVRVMLRIKMVLLLSCFLLYFFLPFDLVPESVFGMLGMLDDLAIVFILLLVMSNMYYNAQAESYQL